jgi:predicted nicotinamide N-methyase
VYDLPQIYKKPTAQELLDALSLLSLQPVSWDHVDSAKPAHFVVKEESSGETLRRPQVGSEGVTKYLTSIVASGLPWLKDDAEREEVWELASARMAERSGRSGMSAMTRNFTIPTKSSYIEISIHEPTLTADNIGFKTWGASYLLSKRLHSLRLPQSDGRPRILELGSGTGLVGMAAAAVLGASVLLTDLPEIESNLTRNVEQNRPRIEALGGSVASAILDWKSPAEIISPSPPQSDNVPDKAINGSGADSAFPIIVAADSIYAKEHPAMLVGAIATWFSTCADARVVIELPRREGYEGELKDFRTRMLGLGLVISEEGDEIGHDDWAGASEGELQDVHCWWSVWQWP